MASRIVHLAIAANLCGTAAPKDPARFLYGSLLPDAAASEIAENKITHYPVYTEDGKRKAFGLTVFREKFWDELNKDALYLGYYLHLLQDILHRGMMRERTFDVRVPGNVEKLHNDYRVVNAEIIRMYGLTLPSVPDGLEKEQLLQEFPFDLPHFRSELEEDFRMRPEGKTVFFHAEDAFRLIGEATEICLAEIRALRTGGEHFDEFAHMWSAVKVKR